MTLLCRVALLAVTAVILLLEGAGIGLEWTAARLVPAQKFLSKKLEAQHDQ